METLLACPNCGQSAFVPYLSCIDYTVSKQRFELTECTHCHLINTNPRPSETEIGPYYESEEYISHTNSRKGLIANIYQIVRNRALKRKVALVKQYAPAGPLLDIGCGTGEFLGAAKKAGLVVKGIEPSPSARQLAIENHKVEVLPEEDLATLPSATFTAITLWHVLEHVHELQTRVAELKRLLSAGGVLFIAVPNPQSFDATYYKEFWAAYDVPRHVNHFKPHVLRSIFEQAGFTTLTTLPMPFDAYYISLLSERYKNGGSTALLKAVQMGWKSNRYAATHADSCSSQLYVFKA